MILFPKEPKALNDKVEPTIFPHSELHWFSGHVSINREIQGDRLDGSIAKSFGGEFLPPDKDLTIYLAFSFKNESATCLILSRSERDIGTERNNPGTLKRGRAGNGEVLRTFRSVTQFQHSEVQKGAFLFSESGLRRIEDKNATSTIIDGFRLSKESSD